MTAKFDSYSLRARVFPVYLTIAPVALALMAILPGGYSLSVGGSAAIIFLPLAFLAKQFGADFGKRLEKALWDKWDGPPTTRFLRHSNNEFNQVTRERVHEKLRTLGLFVPTGDEERQDPQKADGYYESCTEELIRRTRDSSQFPLVLKGLTEYGFRRNLLGLKPLGLIVAGVAVIACGWALVNAWDAEKLPGTAIVATVLTSGLLLVWLTWVTKKTVSIAANRYARFLMEAALDLE